MRFTHHVGFLLIASLMSLSGCSPPPPAPPQAPSPAPAPAPTPAPPPSSAQPDPAPPVPPAPTMPTPSPAPDASVSKPYEGPRVKLEVLQREMHPVQHVAAIEITVPTGGWSLNLDKTEVIDGTANIYLTLERPGDDEMVTQALVTLREQVVRSEPDPIFTKARVFVHLAKRDIHTLTTNYRLAVER